MPEISRFLGIVIKMFFKDHNPPHFHAQYQKFTATIAIKDLKIISGELPPRVYSLVAEWALIHQSDLMNDWQKVKNLQNPTKIKPLV